MSNAAPGVGFEFPPAEVSWLKRDVLLFATSIGCTVDELQFLYELHPKFAVFPTYPILLRKPTLHPPPKSSPSPLTNPPQHSKTPRRR